MLHPGEFVLGSTLELCTLPDDLAGRLEGKSSLGRLGLLTHSTAGFIDPGFSGHITLELSNVANLPITLWPGMKIGQLCILRLTSPAEHPYGSARAGSKYQGQRGPTPSRSYQNFRSGRPSAGRVRHGAVRVACVPADGTRTSGGDRLSFRAGRSGRVHRARTGNRMRGRRQSDPVRDVHPQARVVGIDLSQVQIDQGRRRVQALGLDESGAATG